MKILKRPLRRAHRKGSQESAFAECLCRVPLQSASTEAPLRSASTEALYRVPPRRGPRRGPLETPLKSGFRKRLLTYVTLLSQGVDLPISNQKCFSGLTIVIIRTGRNDDDERHINGHTAVSGYRVRTLHSTDSSRAGENHLGSRASGMQGSLGTGTAWPYYRPESRTLGTLESCRVRGRGRGR